jgi:integrase
MAKIITRGKKQRIELTFNRKRYNIPLPILFPDEHLPLISSHVDEMLKELRSRGIPSIDPQSFTQAILLRYKQHQKNTAPDLPFKQMQEAWIAQLDQKPNTIDGYRKTLNSLNRFFGDSLSPFEAEAEHIQAFVDFRVKEGAARETLLREITTINSLRRFMKRPTILRKDLRLPKTTGSKFFSGLESATDGRKMLLTQDETLELLELVSKRGSKLITDCVKFAIYTGCRREEITRLMPEHLDFYNQTIIITSFKYKQGETTAIRVPMHKELQGLLKKRKNDSPVFTRSVYTLSDGFKRAIKGSRFDVKGFGFHALRHSLASTLIREKVSIPVVSAILGHANITTTLNTYSHPFEEDIQKAMNVLR